MVRMSRRRVLGAAGTLIVAAATGARLRPARAQSAAGHSKARRIVVGRQPLSGGAVAITRYMIDNKLLEAEAAKLGYTLTIDWRNFPNAGPIMELMKSGPEAMSFAFVGNTPVVTSLANNVPLQIVTTAEGTQPFFLLVRPDSPIKKMEDLAGKTIGTFVGLDPQNALIQSLSAQLGKSPDQLSIQFQNFPEFPSLARMPRGIDAAGMIPWSPAYTSIRDGHSVALFDTRGLTGPAYEGGANQRLSGVEHSPFRPEGFYQFRPFWACHADILHNDRDLVLAWLIAYQKGLTEIKKLGPDKVAEANQAEWQQPVKIGVDIITADLLWNRGWSWLCEGDLVSVVAASKALLAAGNIPHAVNWDLVKQHVAPLAPLQQAAWETTGRVPGQADFDKPDSELGELRGPPVWEAAKWGRYADRG
jgi:ABC-type nitrate/sulfonate/bicarbonate transport system substrate-binding protein